MPQDPNITLLDASELKVRYNEHEVLKAASLTIRSGDHLGMVGRNGCGKSTFLKIVAGKTEPNAGRVTTHAGLVTGYLPQDLDMPDADPVIETIRAGAAH